MILYFISNQLSPFYQSKVFSHILQFIQKQPNKFRMKEDRNKLSLTIKNIKNIDEALHILKPFNLH